MYSFKYKYSFYKTLNIDKETRDVIRSFNYLKDKMIEDKESKGINQKIQRK